MPRLRMTLRSGMIAIALVALALAVAIESGRNANDRHGAGYYRARAVFAMRASQQTSGGYRTDDGWVLVGVAASGLLGGYLRRRFLRPR